MLTPIDVIDSAVKIGLGALISGIVTYQLAKASYQKERAQAKKSMIESVARQVARFDQQAARYWQVVINWLDATPVNEDMSADKQTEIKTLEDQVSDGFAELRDAGMMLRLHREPKSQELLTEYANSVKTYRIKSIAKREIGIEALRQYYDAFRQKRETFLVELCDAYERTPSDN